MSDSSDVICGESPTPSAAGIEQRKIPDFEVRRLLGAGGMGEVYEAVQRSTGAVRAIKILPASRFDHHGIEAFEREAKAAAQLQHPHIVPVHDLRQGNGLYYYVMELVPGPSLADLVGIFAQEEAHRRSAKDILELAGVQPDSMLIHGRQGEQVPAYYRIVAQWIAGVAAGLQCAHDHGIWHRDIKPSNLLVAPDGRVMITDFGLAKLEGVETRGAICGTARSITEPTSTPWGSPSTNFSPTSTLLRTPTSAAGYAADHDHCANGFPVSLPSSRRSACEPAVPTRGAVTRVPARCATRYAAG